MKKENTTRIKIIYFVEEGNSVCPAKGPAKAKAAARAPPKRAAKV